LKTIEKIGGPQVLRAFGSDESYPDVVMLDGKGHDLALRAWHEYGDPRQVVHIEEIRAKVSTNHVYRMDLDDGTDLFVKVSLYGSYVHFRQDHSLIKSWIDLLAPSRYASFLASVATVGGEVFTTQVGGASIAFYHRAPNAQPLPRRLSDAEVETFGCEMALFHAECDRCARSMLPTWKSLGSDIAALYDIAGNGTWLAARGFDASAERRIKKQCDTFLHQADLLRIHEMPLIPVLVDWNIGNFSIVPRGDTFEFLGRWDYDWFRTASRVLDFYSCSRVVRDEGDTTTFSYFADPLTEPRFVRFLRSYRWIFPLSENEILFLKEAYRFFILNYVLRSGEHFFLPAICARLQRESLDRYLPALDGISLEGLCEQVFR